MMSCGSGPAVDSKPPTESSKTEPESQPESVKLDPATAEFWNQKYSSDDYIYGTKANVYFKEQLSQLEPGHVLLIAEGEGRNAVWAASQGWKTDAYDLSSAGRQKALALAASQNVEINYWVDDFLSPTYQERKPAYDAVGIVYLHVSATQFRTGVEKLQPVVRPGGKVIIEVFSESHPATGSKFGPKSADALFTTAEIRDAFSDAWTIEQLEEETIVLDEGFHQGDAKVIRCVAVRN